MDKVKTILGHLRKHHFWVLSGILLVTGLAGWFMATSAVSADTKTKTAKIEDEFRKVNGITGDLPNKKWEQEFDKSTVEVKKDVWATWNQVYNEQKEYVLTWPKALGEEFITIVQSLRVDQDIPLKYREKYHTYIREQFSRLLEIVDAENLIDDPSPSGKARVAVGPMRRPNQEVRRDPTGRPLAVRPAAKAAVAQDEEEATKHDYKVVWNLNNQQAIVKMLTWSSTPSSEQVRQTQENIWVCEALLNIIRKMNARATGHHNAKVKEIEVLSFGQDAAKEFLAGTSPNRIMQIQPPDATKPGQVADPYAGAAKVTAPTNREEMARAATGEASGSALEENRYVDAQGKPLTSSAEAPAEFKRMPVFMRLHMDQREISRLLAECADSPLPVEVRQFRLNPPRTTGVAGAVNIRQRGFGGKAGEPRRAEVVGRPVSGLAESAPGDSENPYDVTIEIHGIIYIFNPPDTTKVMLTSADAAATPIEAPAPPSAPAAETPAAEKQPAAEAKSETATTTTDEPGTDEPAAEAEMDTAADGSAPAEDTDDGGN